jgi:hypothetical protein
VAIGLSCVVGLPVPQRAPVAQSTERAPPTTVERPNSAAGATDMAKVLGHFSITQEADGYLLHLEDEEGDTVEYGATFEQLDLIAEAIEEQLDADEEDALGVDDEETAAIDEE